MTTEMLFNPTGFFVRLAQREPRIWPACAVYLLAVLLSALGSQLAVRSLPSPVAIGNPWLWAGAGSLEAALVVWGIFGFLVMLASGTGARAFEVVGWAAAPGVVTGLLLLAAGAMFPIQGVVPLAPSDPTQPAEWMRTYQAVVQSSTFTEVSRVLGLVMLIWSGWIVYAGVGVFARSRAALAAGVYLVLQLGVYFLGSVRLGRMKKTLAWTGWLLMGAAFAFGPEAALDQKPPGYAAALLDAELARWESAFARAGLRGSASAGYGEDWSYGVSLQLSLDPEPRARADVAALEAQLGLRAQVRKAVYEALILHARVWKAQAEREAAARALEEARLRLEAARVQGHGPLDLDEQTYRVEDARLALELAEAELAGALDEAREKGFSGAAEPRVLRFELPAPADDLLGTLRLQQQRAAAAKAWRGLVVLNAQARYLGPTNYTFEATSAGPDLTFSLQHPAMPASEEWKLSVGARIVLDPIAWTRARRAQLAAERLAEQQKAKELQRARRLTLMRKRALGAWRRLELAQRRAELARRRAEQAKARWAAGMLPQLNALSAEVAALRAEGQTADAWRAYLDAVKAYLDLAGGEWRAE